MIWYWTSGWFHPGELHSLIDPVFSASPWTKPCDWRSWWPGPCRWSAWGVLGVFTDNDHDEYHDDADDDDDDDDDDDNDDRGDGDYDGDDDDDCFLFLNITSYSFIGFHPCAGLTIQVPGNYCNILYLITFVLMIIDVGWMIAPY